MQKIHKYFSFIFIAGFLFGAGFEIASFMVWNMQEYLEEPIPLCYSPDDGKLKDLTIYGHKG